MIRLIDSDMDSASPVKKIQLTKILSHRLIWTKIKYRRTTTFEASDGYKVNLIYSMDSEHSFLEPGRLTQS